MIHVRAIKTPHRGKNTPMYAFHGSGFGPPTIAETLRRGVLLATVAAVLILVGLIVLFVWYDMTSKVPLGPLVIMVGGLLLLLSLRQFWVVWKHKHNPAAVQQAEGSQVQEEEEMPYGTMMEMDSLDNLRAEKLQSQQDSYIVNSQVQPLGTIGSPIITPSVIPTYTLLMQLGDPKQFVNSAYNPQRELAICNQRQQFTDSGYYRQPAQGNSCTSEQQGDLQLPGSTLATPVVTTTSCDSRVRSCSDLSSVSRSSSTEAPNPRPVIRYSQGQLEMLDRATASVAGRTSPILVKSSPSQKSLGNRSASPQPSTFKSLSLSAERTDVVETI